MALLLQFKSMPPSHGVAFLMPSSVPRNERISNAHLVWDGGNQYAAAAPYFSVPGWWRRFFFTVLSARDVAVYTYICSQMDEHGVAYPTYQNIKADLNISNARIIKASITRLVHCGFLLVKRIAPLRMNRHTRNVYQRPSVEYTLRELLSNGYVDTDFRSLKPRPAAAATRGDQPGRNIGSLRAGLFRLLGAQALRAWETAAPDDKQRVLLDWLQRRIIEKKLRYEETIAPTIDPASQREAERLLGEGGDGPTITEYVENLFGLGQRAEPGDDSLTL
jgi:hypothetical protein